jgi:hypothetical protein
MGRLLFYDNIVIVKKARKRIVVKWCYMNIRYRVHMKLWTRHPLYIIRVKVDIPKLFTSIPLSNSTKEGTLKGIIMEKVF